MAKEGETGAGPDWAGDHTLMKRIHAGDPLALDDLVKRYWNPLVAYVERLLGSRESAEDVVQDAVLRIWESRDHWSPSHRLSGFLYRTARNLALNQLKHARIRREKGHDIPSRSPVPTPAETFAGFELLEALEVCLDELSPKRREVFILSRYHGHSYQEIAEIMGVSPQTVANHMTAALDELRHRLQPFLPRPHSHRTPAAS